MEALFFENSNLMVSKSFMSVIVGIIKLNTGQCVCKYWIGSRWAAWPKKVDAQNCEFSKWEVFFIISGSLSIYNGIQIIRWVSSQITCSDMTWIKGRFILFYRFLIVISIVIICIKKVEGMCHLLRPTSLLSLFGRSNVLMNRERQNKQQCLARDCLTEDDLDFYILIPVFS